jgi:hypothetical protein
VDGRLSCRASLDRWAAQPDVAADLALAYARSRPLNVKVVGQTTMWEDDFYSLLASDDRKGQDPFTLKAGHIPTRLYKYRSPTDFALRGLEQGTAWLSAAGRFNDPYDSSICIESEATLRSSLLDQLLAMPNMDFSPAEEKEIRGARDPLATLLREISKKRPTEFSEAQAQKMAVAIAETCREESLDLSRRFTAIYQIGVKACSFSTNHLSLPMWSHYTNSHRGFCIAYSVEGLPEDDVRRRLLFPVRYRRERFTLSDDFHRIVRAGPSLAAISLPILAATHKSPDWAYEEEWRLINQLGTDSPGMDVVMPTPTELYLGTRMQQEYRERVIEIASRRRIPLYEMTLSPKEFKLEPRSL